MNPEEILNPQANLKGLKLSKELTLKSFKILKKKSKELTLTNKKYLKNPWHWMAQIKGIFNHWTLTRQESFLEIIISNCLSGKTIL